MEFDKWVQQRLRILKRQGEHPNPAWLSKSAKCPYPRMPE